MTVCRTGVIEEYNLLANWAKEKEWILFYEQAAQWQFFKFSICWAYQNNEKLKPFTHKQPNCADKPVLPHLSIVLFEKQHHQSRTHLLQLKWWKEITVKFHLTILALHVIHLCRTVLTIWSVLTYDRLEDRWINDVNTVHVHCSMLFWFSIICHLYCWANGGQHGHLHVHVFVKLWSPWHR